MRVGNTILNSKRARILKAIAWIFIIAASYLSVAAAYISGIDPDLKPSDIALHEKIEAYKKNDKRRQAVEMEPIIPTRNQRLSPAFVDEDKDGESDFVLIPYCINGSFFDDDPGNNAIQVALKYKLVTRKDLLGRTLRERFDLEERMGLWMWDKPSEILTSFNDHPGPDIVFYDLGTVVNSRVIYAEPDGKFDKFEFLY